MTTSRRLRALTDRQRQVAELVGRGMTNREIAERLGIAESTVKRHMTNVMVKLDAINRAQVADIMARQQAPDL